MSNFTIQQLHTIEEFNATVALQQTIWQMPASLCVAPYTMLAVSHQGGAVHGAKTEDGQLVGFSFAFAGRHDGNHLLWSHIAGVHPDFQGHHIGYKIKQAQRTWALANGYAVIGWTFDPMQQGNASFNFNRLGAIARVYRTNVYGKMDDGINAGLASDRLEISWNLDSPRVVSLAQGPPPSPKYESFDTKQTFLVRQDGDDLAVMTPPANLTQDSYALEIPYNLNHLKQSNIQLASAWQLAIRHAMLHLLSHNYFVADFIRTNDRCWYDLQRSTP